MFSNVNKINKSTDQIEKSNDIQNIKKLQTELKYFDRGFSFIFSKYFRRYKKRIKIFGEILRECYYTFDKINNITSYNVETYSPRSSNLIIDFSSIFMAFFQLFYQLLES